MKKDILKIIQEYTHLRLEKAKEILPRERVELLASESSSGGGKFYQAIGKSGVSMICEIKKASPSKGVIDEVFDYMQILSDYENGGADALSVLTEPKFFCGSNMIFSQVREKTQLPMLRKDFIVDEYQLYESKALGADAVLLICAMLSKETVQKFYRVARELNLDVLVETHSDDELYTALDIGADIIGVNSRNLKTFDVSLDGGLEIIKKAKSSKGAEVTERKRLFVLESGVATADDIQKIKSLDGDGALVGETLMRAKNRVELLQSFKAVGNES